MEYFFILVAQLLGIGFHVGQKIIQLDKANPEKSIKEVRSLFFENEWSSLFVSGLIVLAHLFIHGMVQFYMPEEGDSLIDIPFTTVKVPFGLAGVLLAIVLGYAGQRIAYKYLGKAEEYLSKKAE